MHAALIKFDALADAIEVRRPKIITFFAVFALHFVIAAVVGANNNKACTLQKLRRAGVHEACSWARGVEARFFYRWARMASSVVPVKCRDLPVRKKPSDLALQ